jgi:hypothetical protein
MAVSDTDLLLVQRGTVPYKTTAADLASYTINNIDVDTDLPIASASQLGVIKVGANLTIEADGTLNAGLGGAVTYKGTANFTDAADPALTGPTSGDLYSNTTGGTGAWTGFAGDAVVVGDRALFDGTTWQLLNADSVGGLSEITATAPVAVTPVVDGKQDVSMPAATASNDGYMPKEAWDKLDNIEGGAEVNVDPTQTYTAAATNGALTLSPGGDVTTIPAATDTTAGLMTAADKVILDNLVTSPGGVASVLAGDGIEVNTSTAPGSASTPEVGVKFAGTGADDTTLVMPANLNLLDDLP